MDIFLAFKSDHSEIKSMLAKLAQSPSNQRLFEQFKVALCTHNNIEENCFYNHVNNVSGLLAALVRLNKREHSLLEEMIMQYDKIIDTEKPLLISLIKKTIEAYIDKEENEMFSLTQNSIPSESLAKMLSQFQKERNELKTGTLVD